MVFFRFYRTLSVTSVKVSRVPSASKKRRSERMKKEALAPLKDERGKKERGFLNEKYIVKLSLHLLLPNRFSPVLPLSRHHVVLPRSYHVGVESDSRFRKTGTV